MAVASENKDFRFKPNEPSLDRALDGVPVCDPFKNIKRRARIAVNIVKNDNIATITTVKPFSCVVWGFDPSGKSVLFI